MCRCPLERLAVYREETTHTHNFVLCMLFGGLKGTRLLQSRRESLAGPGDTENALQGASTARCKTTPLFMFARWRRTASYFLLQPKQHPAPRCILHKLAPNQHTRLQTATSCFTPKPRRNICSTGNSPLSLMSVIAVSPSPHEQRERPAHKKRGRAWKSGHTHRFFEGQLRAYDMAKFVQAKTRAVLQVQQGVHWSAALAKELSLSDACRVRRFSNLR